MQKSTVTANNPIESASTRNLRRIFVLRSVMWAFLVAIVMVLFALRIPMHYTPILASLAALAGLNIWTWYRLTSPQQVSHRELFAQLVADIAILSALFYFTGGYSNPFVWMYLLPIAVGAVALTRTYTWLLALMAVACYSCLVFFHVPLSHLHVHDIATISLDIHLVGMWMGFVVSAGIIAFFVTRIGQNLRDYDHMIADARERTLESERMMALGTLAASAAHELGTPLATMAVISKELQRAHADNPNTSNQLKILSTQIMRCKEILSSLSASSGNERASSGQAISVQAFLDQALARWRDTRPATVLVAEYEPSTDIMIYADRTLTQALQNMLDNAADASPSHISFKAHWSEKLLSVSIRDFGNGLSPEVAEKVGTPFFSTKQKQGLGLGVYLTRAVLARYQGSLSLDNHPDGGVLVEIKLPLHQLMTKNMSINAIEVTL